MDLKRENVYRNSRCLYGSMDSASMFSGYLIDFCRAHAGKKILDFGCASGNYCLELSRLGFECTGVDVNEEYVRTASGRGVNALLIKDSLPFEDKSFDTALLFEVLEHVKDPLRILKEAKRAAGRNVLLTVPNNSEFEMLKKLNLTYEHMLEDDHINFFTKDSLSELLSQCFKRFTIKKEEPVAVQGLLPWYLRKAVSLGMMTGIVRPRVYFRLYAECLV